MKSGFADRTAVTPDDETDDGNLPYYGGSFDLAMAMINRVSPFGTYETRHLFSGLVGLIGLFAAWRLGERLRGPSAGFLTLALLATVPAYYGHMFINPKDMPFAAAMCVVLLSICGVLEEWPRPRWPSVLPLASPAASPLALASAPRSLSLIWRYRSPSGCSSRSGAKASGRRWPNRRAA